MKRNGKKMFAVMFCLVMLCAMLPMQTFAKSISLNTSKKGTFTVGDKFTLTGISGTVKWTSSNTKVASVSQKGVVTVKGAGKSIIRAKTKRKTKAFTLTAKKPSYKEAYRKLLAKGTVKAGNEQVAATYFKVLNIDGKNEPELIVVNPKAIFGGTKYYVYTYKAGKVKYSGSCLSRSTNSVPTVYYSKKCKGIQVDLGAGGYGAGEEAYGISGTKLIRKHHMASSRDGKFYVGTTNKQNKKVSSSAWVKFHDKYFKNLKKYKMLANTAANRKKI